MSERDQQTIQSTYNLLTEDTLFDQSVPMSTEGLAVSSELGPYTIVQLLGSGAMGAVYAATDSHGRRVALKLLRNLQPARLLMLKREFRLLTRVSHPNLVPLYELLAVDGRWFFTMQLVDGLPFNEPARGWRQAEGGEVRLRALARQLAVGIDALHASGLLHLDLKPANVLVDGDDAVRILDFGLVQDTDRADPHAPRGGTPTHMAPEQYRGQDVTEAADWYAFGVMLAELLSDTPITGPRSPSPFDTIDEAGLPDLARLATALVAPEPADRPTGEAVLAAFGAAPAPRQRRSTFVGRASELTQLHAAYRDAADGRSVAVWVQGTSGMGKSTLIRRFLDQLPGAPIVLRGRCFERERVPYRGFDAVVDELATTLRALRGTLPEALDSSEIAEAARLFPTLQLYGTAPLDEQESDDPAAARARAFAGLRGVLVRLRRLAPVVLVIDDIHWGDADTARLLAGLLEPPDPPPLLVIGCYRPEAAGNPFERELAELGESALRQLDQRTIVLQPLADAEAGALVASLRGDGDAEAASRLLDECGGSPFLLETLAREEEPLPGGERSLQAVMRRKLADLAPGRLEILRLVAALGQPAPVELLADLVDSDEALPDTLVHLQANALVRVDGLRDDDRIEMHHDRLREGVLDLLAPTARASLHEHIATRLELRGDTPPDTLATQYHAAGLLPRAARFAEEAGDVAMSTLAFAHAAESYRHALQWAPGSPRRKAIMLSRARALYNDGRVLDAAAAWKAVVPSLPPEQQGTIARYAAEASMLGGRIPEGVEILDSHLREMNLPGRRGAARTGLSVLLHLAWLLIAGPEPRAGRGADAANLERADLCWSLGKGLAFVLPVDGLDYVLRSIRLALRAGDAGRANRGLAFLAAGVFHQIRPLQRLSTRYLAQARAEAERAGAEEQLASLGAWEGMVAVGAGDWGIAERRLEEAVTVLTAQPGGFHWERQVAAGLLVWLYQLDGDLNLSRESAMRFLREARERGDIYGRVLFTQYVAYADIARGSLAQAREQTRWIREDWGRGAFTIPVYYATMIEVLADLYDGDSKAALERWSAIQPSFKKGGGDFAPATVIDNSLYHARVLIAEGPDAAVLKQLRKLAARLEALPRRDGPAIAAWIRAVESGDEAALDASARALADAGLHMHSWCVRLHLAARGGDAAGLSESRSWLVEHGAADPDRWAGAFMPIISAG